MGKSASKPCHAQQHMLCLAQLLPNAKQCCFSVGASSKPPKTRRGGAVRGASNGKLLPGEKKRLKKEKMNAKRAARSASHGLDLESVNAELVQFVATDGDMKVCSTRVKLQSQHIWQPVRTDQWQDATTVIAKQTWLFCIHCGTV